MGAKRFSRALLLAAAVGLATGTRSADTRPDETNYGLPTPSTLTPEQQRRILLAFRAAHPPLQTFARNFQAAQFSIVRSDSKSSHITIAAAMEAGRFSIALVFTGSFDPEFTRLLKSRCELFGAYDNERELQPRAKRAPLRLSLDDMDAFCRDPEEFLRKQFAAAPQP